MKEEQKTIQEWFEQAKAEGYEWADAAMENSRKSGYLKVLEPSLSEAIIFAFRWWLTPQGFDYWSEIYDDIKKAEL